MVCQSRATLMGAITCALAIVVCGCTGNETPATDPANQGLPAPPPAPPGVTSSGLQNAPSRQPWPTEVTTPFVPIPSAQKTDGTQALATNTPNSTATTISPTNPPVTPSTVTPPATSVAVTPAPGPSVGLNEADLKKLSQLYTASNTWLGKANDADRWGMKYAEDDSKDSHPVNSWSWMTQLLPYLEHKDIYDRIDLKRFWGDQGNIEAIHEVIPEFISSRTTVERLPRYEEEQGPALTYFVGMSGLEQRTLAAGALPRSDPQAGMFGYQGIAKPEEITDGLGNTIMIIEVGKSANPWAWGGGATIRGALEPYFDKLTGYGASGADDVQVIFADGSARTISKSIDPAVFRALCTIHGAESVDLGSMSLKK